MMNLVTRSEQRLDFFSHLSWMLDEMREGKNKIHFYNNYMNGHRTSELLTEEERKYFDTEFNKAHGA